MKKISKNILMLPIPMALLCAFGTYAQAQQVSTTPGKEGTESKVSKAENGAVQQLDTIVVTGSARSGGRRKLTTTFSISSANENQIKEAAASSAADLLKVVPGIFAETTGGTTGANIEIRGFPSGGDAPYVSMQVEGSPLYPLSELSFMENSSMFRLDDTVERVEVLRGGPSPIWSNAQPGATVNYILKKGGEVPEGSLRYTTGTGSLNRFDVFYSGKISDGWYGSVGGFYRTSKGIRNTEYPADEGGQFTGTLTHKFDGGQITLWTRILNDKNTFYVGVPLRTDGGTNYSGFPGFDPLTGALQGNAIRNVLIETTPGSTPGTKALNLADGRGAQLQHYGFDFDKTVGGWEINSKTGFMSGNLPTTAIFTGATPQTLGSYIDGKITAANGSSGVVNAAGGLASTGTASYVGGNVITDPNLMVYSNGIWNVEKKLQAFTNDTRFTRELFKGNSLSLGLYFASYSSEDTWFLGNGMLMTAQSHAKPIDVTLNNGVKVTRNGFDGASFFSYAGSYSGKDVAVTVADDWQVNDQLRVDAGYRMQRNTFDGSIGQPVSQDLDANPLTIYNNNASVNNGTYVGASSARSRGTWTLGAGYMLTEKVNTFVRINSGVRFPMFDDYRSQADRNPATEKVDQYEVGIKAQDKYYAAYLTAFYNKFKGKIQTQILGDGTRLQYNLASKSHGLEFEGALRPLAGLDFALGGSYIDGQYSAGGPDVEGNQIIRQPKIQFRFTPSYKIQTDWGSVKAYLTYHQIGKRYADLQNEQILPSYHTVDAGLIAEINDSYDIRLTGTNLTNTLGLTEGNGRVIGGSTGNTFIARPIFGRAFQLAIGLKF